MKGKINIPKIIKIIFIVILATLFLAVFLLFIFICQFMPSKVDADRYLKKNEQALTDVIQYLQACPYKRLSFRYNHYDDKKAMSFSVGDLKDESEIVGTVLLEENDLKQIEYLFKKCKFQVIIKDNNYVSFQRWSTLDTGWGILYLFEGDKPESDYATFLELEELSVDGWYYYEEE